MQIAKSLGAIVRTTVASSETASLAKELGADETILYREQTVPEYIEQFTAERGYDVIFDTIGGPNRPNSLEALAHNALNCPWFGEYAEVGILGYGKEKMWK